MSWLSRLARGGPGSRTGRSVAPPCTADPETCLMVFENHWRQVSWVLEQREPSSSSDDLSTVRNNTDQMLCLLAEERPGEGGPGPQDGGGGGGGGPLPPMGPILKLVTSEDVLERLVQWHLRRGLDPDSQGALLKLFEMLIGQSQQPLLRHTAVLQPLLLLLGASGDPQLGGCPPALENSLVLLLNQVCVSMARQPVVLEMLFRAAPAQHAGPTNLLIFSLLVPFIHRDGALGQQARDALLLVMATSASHQAVARYITENSYFCPVLATGLSALYSSLPRKMEVRGDDWHALRREDWMGVSSLVLFMNSLEFCNAVVQVAHPLVSSQLLDYLHNGFLVPVMGPALHKSSVDEMIASTAYLDLFLRSVTETALLRTFLRFILLHRHDDHHDTILDTLLTRISSNSRLCMVSLSLFRTLLSLNCEDLMLQLVLRYLLPCTHVMLSQRRAVRETDLYGKSADKFLSLIPECCRISTGERDDDDAFWGKALNNSPMRSESPVLQARPSTPNRLALFMRQQSGGGGGGGGGPTTPTGGTESPSSSPLRRGSIPASSLSSPDSPMHHQQQQQQQQPAQAVSTECLDWESGYLEYLRDARRSVEHCSWACRDWSAPYDGENPSPNVVPLPPPPPSLLAVSPDHFSFQQQAPGGGGSGGGNTPPPPPASQRAAVVAAARSEWSGTERDSGEWDVTIGKNHCISLTPRSKKRSLQREELPLPTKPLLLPSFSSPSSSPSLSNSSCPPLSSSSSSAMVVAPHHQPMFNGTSSGQPDACVSVDSLEVKKVKRDLGEQHAQQRRRHLDENSNQNGAHDVVVASQATTTYSEVDDGDGDISDNAVVAPPIASQGSNNIASSPDTNSLTTTDDTDTPSETPPVLKDVHLESLIKELLEQAPGDLHHHHHQQQLSSSSPGDSNGQGISIEAFTQELRELEERVRERNRAAAATTRQPEETTTAALTGRREEEEEEEECRLASAPEGGGGEAKGEGSAVGLCSPVKPLGQPTGQPYTGPFMVVVFAKLENMLQNSLYVNILLTGIVAQLACYPQPLLRSFLLNTNMVFQPSVKSLIQVLGSVKNRIEAFAASHGDFPAMLRRAQRYLAARNQSPTAAHTLRRSDSLVKSRKPSLGDLILRHTNSPTRARHAAQLALAHVRDGGQSLHSALFRGGGGASGGGAAASASGGGSGGGGGGATSSLEKQAEALRVKNAVYCAVIFSEFLKELAALAQEHAVAIPFPHSQGASEE